MNLTINEQLMHDTNDANLCIFIANLAGWIRTNAGKLHKPIEQRNFREDRYWSYNSIEGLVKYFGFWSTQNIKTIIKNCIAHGLIVTSNFNKVKFDQTCWYSLTDKALDYYPLLREITTQTATNPHGCALVRSNQPFVRSNNAIPELHTTCSNNTITTNTSSKPKGNELLRELIEVYRQEFPNNPQPHKSLISTSLEKVLRTLVKRWPEADPVKRAITPESFRQYLSALKTLAPKFSLGEYETPSGARKKNSLETFARWNTLVKFLENQYS